ncbi:MAG TPA: DNA polymerase domain-containing protein [Thermotogota bacterium]|nr:DNA polymerase domain-containing protein [Thermotogota bacterium]
MYQNIFYDKEQRLLHLWDDESGYSVIHPKRYGYVKSETKTNFRDLHGNYVKRVYNIYDLDESELLESDVNIEQRYLIDLYYECNEGAQVKNNTVVLDIEVDAGKAFPDIKKALNAITAIALYDYNTDRYIALLLNEHGTEINSENAEILSYNTESELLLAFIKIHRELNPTILTGWNMDGFDIPYLINRMRRVIGDEETVKISPIDIISYDDINERYVIPGISVLDYLKLYKKFTFSQERNYRLDTIGKKELGYGKIEYEGSLQDLYNTDINKYVEYNINDVKIVKELNDKLKFIDFTVTISIIGKIKYEDIYSSSRYIDGAILSYLKLNNLVAPNKKRDNIKTTFEGAYVKPPTPGLYPFVYDLDLTSLYPSIIMSLNISPETKVGKVLNYIDNPTNDYQLYSFKLNKTVKLSKEKFNEMLVNNNLYIASNGVLYESKLNKEGIIPNILSKWFDKRVEYKNKMKKYGKSGNTEKYKFYDKLQYAQKVLLNSVYGVLGLSSFRFYDLDNAAAVTTSGQTIIKNAADSANEFYYNKTKTQNDYVIYVDTDSLFLSLKPLIPELTMKNFESNKNLINKSITHVQNYINKSFDELAKNIFNIKDTHRFNIKQEMIAKNAIWLAKKRYAMLVIDREGIPEDKLEIKGIDVVRSSFPFAFVGFLKQLLYDILNGLSEDEVNNKILEFESQLKSTEASKLCKNTSVNNIKKFKETRSYYNSIFSTIKKGAPVHVKSAIYFNDLLKYFKLDKHIVPITSGEKVIWCYLKNNPYHIDSLAYRGYEDPSEIINIIDTYIDRQKMYESELKSKIDDLYNSIGWVYPSKQQQLSIKFFD